MAKPKIRFKGFTDDWEQRKLGDLVEKYEDPIDTPTDGYMRLGIRSHAKGTFHSYVEKGKELETAKMFRVAANNFIVNITFGWEHAVAITDESDAGKLVSHRFPQYSFENGMIPMFFKYLILDENFKHHLELSSPGGAGRNRVLKLNDMLEYKMKFPCEDEQRKLASYFDDLDHLITLHQRKCEETKKLKKYMLQKMFPQNGRTVPEIRFAGFTDAWEQRKLGDIFKEYSEKGHTELPTLTIIQGGGTVKREDSDRNLMYDEANLSNYKMVRKDDFIVHLRSFEGGLEKASLNGIISPAYHTFHSDEADSRFYYPYFRSFEFIKHKLVPHVYGIRDGRSIDIEGMKCIEIPYTSLSEQRKIGDYLELLDHIITLHQHKCEQLQNMKKFMLQNMFV